MTEPAFEHVYSMHILTRSSFFRLYANGAPIDSNAKFLDRSQTRPAEKALQHGENRVIIDYEPFDLDERDYVPHDGIYFRLTLTQLKGLTTGRTTLLTLRYSPEEDSLVQVQGAGDQLGDQFVEVTDVDIAPVDITYRSRNSGDHARRIRIDFTINDPSLAPVPWADSPELPDTPETRQLVWEFGQRLHQAYADRDVETWTELTEPYLTRVGQSIGGKDLQYVVDALLERGAMSSGIEGAVLRPYLTEQDAMTEPFQPLPDPRLVSFETFPAEFAVPGEELGSVVPFYLCMRPEGLRVCYYELGL
ncbi:MAG: hypothetical protein GVY31_10520 [Alphaproteobacteria bacterium]|nr:hypothetical protein [Alphaproteobacteria bacterium]